MSNNPPEGSWGLNKLMSEHLEEGLVLRKCCIFGAIIMFVAVITVGLALQNVWRNADFPGAGEKQRQGVHSAQPGGSLAQGINTGNCQLVLSIPLAFPFH